jgi:hypothetical protein
MAKSINVSGRMSVERFNDEFQKAFGVRCNVKISKWVNADDKATLASIRPKDFKGPSKVDLSIVGNMTVGTLKKRFEENFGVMIELYIGRKIAPDDVTIGAIREGRAKASKGEKPTETAPKTPKPDKPGSAEKPSGSDLTEEQIKDFKDQEKEAEDSYDYYSLAAEIAEAGDKDWAGKLYTVAEQKAEDISVIQSLLESMGNDEYYNKTFESVFEKALELAKDAEKYQIESLVNSLKEIGFVEKAEILKNINNVNIKLGIKYDFEIEGDSIFRCTFAIDWNYYEEQTGDEGPEWFDFIYDFKNGIIITYNDYNAELDCVRVPYHGDDLPAEWQLGHGGDDIREWDNGADLIQCQQTGSTGDTEGEHIAEMEEIVKIMDGAAFKKLAEKALNKIKEYEGIA